MKKSALAEHSAEIGGDDDEKKNNSCDFDAMRPFVYGL